MLRSFVQNRIRNGSACVGIETYIVPFNRDVKNFAHNIKASFVLEIAYRALSGGA